MDSLSPIAKSIRSKSFKSQLQIIAVTLFSSYAVTSHAQWFPSIGPRMAATGLSGDYTTGEGDLLIPTYGDNDRFVYTDFDGKYGTSGSTSLASGGAGYRGIYDDRILGGYVFADRNVSPQRNTFWVINPGIESLGRTWDFRANGYLPLEQEQNVGNAVFAESLGIYTDTTFSGHNQYDALLQQFESTGFGGDAEIGRKVPYFPKARAYVGGYYFGQEDANSIQGVAGRVEYQLGAHTTLLAADTYDNLNHNVIEAGVRFTLDKTSENQDELSTRLLTPVVRHLANLNNGNGIPISEGTKQVGNGLVQSNIYFFTPNGDPSPNAQCTFENPCNGNDFATWLNTNTPTLPTGSNFYFAQGEQYPAVNTTGTGALEIPTSFSVWGRSSNFQAPQTVPFAGSFELGSSTALHNVAIYNDPSFPEGILIVDSTNVLLDAVQVGTPGGAGNGSDFTDGVDITNSSVQINNSSINSFSNSSVTTGIKSINSAVTVDGSTVTTTGVGSIPTGSAAIRGDSTSQLNVFNSSVTSNINSSTAGFLNIYGIVSLGTLNVINSTVNVSATGTSTNLFNAYGIRVFGSGSIAAIDGSTINAAATGNNESSVFGVDGDTGATVNILQSTVNVTGGGGSFAAIAGAFNDMTSNLTVSGSTFNVTGTPVGDSGDLYGIQGLGGTITVNNSRINVSGSQTGGTSIFAIGINQGNNSTLNISNSTINVSATGNETTASAFGIRSVTNDTATIQNSIFHVSATSTGAGSSAYSYGLYAFGGGQLSVNRSFIMSTAQGVANSGAAGIDTSGHRFNATDGTATASTISNDYIISSASGSNSNTGYGVWYNVTNPANISFPTIFVHGDAGKTCTLFIQNGATGTCIP